jgi:hypothetical protein
MWGEIFFILIFLALVVLTIWTIIGLDLRTRPKRRRRT